MSEPAAATPPPDAAPEPPLGAPAAGPPWGAAHVVMAVGLVLLLLPALGAAAGTLRGWLPRAVGALAAFSVATALGVALAARFAGGGARDLGLGTRGAGAASLRAVGGYVLLVPLLLASAYLWRTVLDELGFEHEPQEVAQLLLELEGTWAVAGAVLGAAVAPFAEELAFRGFLQPVLVRGSGPLVGVLATSALFAALHDPSVALPILVLSLYLGRVRLRSGSLWAAWSVHAAHNAVMIAVLHLEPEAASPG